MNVVVLLALYLAELPLISCVLSIPIGFGPYVPTGGVLNFINENIGLGVWMRCTLVHIKGSRVVIHKV